MQLTCALLCLLLTFASVARADEPHVIEGIVISVHDGDTLRIGDQSIRLWGIDSVELEQRCDDSPCGDAARVELAQLVLGFPVTCEIKGKSYNRLVGQCFVLGLDVAQRMIESGMAFAEDKYSKGYYRPDEQKARATSLGLWSFASVEVPAEWRARHSR